MSYSTVDILDKYKILLSSTYHYIFLSSYRVFADSGHMPLNEESGRLLDTSNDNEYLATDEYGLAKTRQENIFRESTYKNWTITRPGITYSQSRFQLCTLEANTICLRVLRGISVALPEECPDKYNTLTWGGDVAKFITALALQGFTKSEVFNFASSETHKWRDIL